MVQHEDESFFLVLGYFWGRANKAGKCCSAHVEADSKSNCSRTPLSSVVAGGHEVVLKLLVKRNDVERTRWMEEA